MDLLDRFQEIFPKAQIAYICGDREFVGKTWLTYLLIDPVVPFRLRIRAKVFFVMALIISVLLSLIWT